MMKYLLILLLTLSANVFAENCPEGSNSPNCSGDYPGYVPTWDDRYSVGCQITQNGSDPVVTNFQFKHGNLDYAQGGTMMVYLQEAVAEWYADIKEAAAGEGVDSRLIPTPGSKMGDLIAIEKFMSGKFDE